MQKLGLLDANLIKQHEHPDRKRVDDRRRSAENLEAQASNLLAKETQKQIDSSTCLTHSHGRRRRNLVFLLI